MVSEYSAASVRGFYCLAHSKLVISGFKTGLVPLVNHRINSNSEYTNPKSLLSSQNFLNKVNSVSPSFWMVFSKYYTDLLMSDSRVTFAIIIRRIQCI